MKGESKQKKQNKTNKQRQKGTRGDRSYSERVRAKCFCCAFKLAFLRLICKASLIFKSNLELALSITLKQRELYEPVFLYYPIYYWRIDVAVIKFI